MLLQSTISLLLLMLPRALYAIPVISGELNCSGDVVCSEVDGTCSANAVTTDGHTCAGDVDANVTHVVTVMKVAALFFWLLLLLSTIVCMSLVALLLKKKDQPKNTPNNTGKVFYTANVFDNPLALEKV